MLVNIGILILSFSGILGDTTPPCETQKPECANHEHYVREDTTCIKTCANIEVEKKPTNDCKPFTGCVCDKGFVRRNDDATGPCIPRGKCPPICPKHEHYVKSDRVCIKTCGNQLKGNMGNDTDCDCKPFAGCVCNNGYVRKFNDGSGPCIPKGHCPPRGCKGDRNATQSDCPSACPATCKNPKPEICTLQCMPPGCVCNPGYLLNETGKCIKPEDCPEQKGCNGDCNAMHSDCPSACPATCEDPDPQRCTKQCMPPGCVCKPRYVLDKSCGKCVKLEECPAPRGCKGDRNATQSDCPSACPATCKNPKPEICTLQCMPPGCVCNPGYLLNETGKCIKPEDCPGCNGDPKAMYSQCPSACPATCDDPDPQRCTDQCMPPGCVCKPGHLLNKTCGKCINPDECPGGMPNCGVNKTFTHCKIECPSNYCPTSDSREKIICDPEDPCPSGCVCQPRYFISNEDGRCIAGHDCPPVKCTRPYEEWDPEPPRCLRERCPSYDNDYCDIYSGPKCVCKEGYYRNDKDICVPLSKCPCPVPKECRRTCENPNPENCINFFPLINVDSCMCVYGYVLEKPGGKCIPVEECPSGCNGDDNARAKVCPPPCPSTCQAPNAVPCKRPCEPIACACNPGHLLSNRTGRCILPEQCPGGNPCGKNEHFADCRTNCEEDYCPQNDNTNKSDCETPPNCLSGCVCDEYYKRLSYVDPQCIKSSECPS